MASGAENALVKIVARRLFIGLMSMGAVVIFAAVMLRNSEYLAPVLIVVCGLIGGFIGIQRRLKELTPADLDLLAHSWIYTILAPLVGGILAVILYMLFLSGLLSGDLFPQFAADDTAVDAVGFQKLMAQHGVAYQDYVKMLVWSFVAGYSEKFVTDVVARFEGSAVSAAPQ